MSAIGPAAYSEAVWARFCTPGHAGRTPGAPRGCARSAAHQLEVCFYRADGRYTFSAIGCPTTIAVADYCAEMLGAGHQPKAEVITNALEIGEDRRHCVLLCEDAMAALMAELAEDPSPHDRQAS